MPASQIADIAANGATTIATEQSVDLKYCTTKAGEILHEGHKQFDRVFEKEGGKILSIHRDTMELCILKNEKSSIWEKLCLSCLPVAISLFICVMSTKEFNGESQYWSGFMTASAIGFAIVGISSGVAWWGLTKSKKSIFEAITENCIGHTSVIKDNAPISNTVLQKKSVTTAVPPTEASPQPSTAATPTSPTETGVVNSSSDS